MSSNVRYLSEQILKDLQGKMVFLGGPRQVGKTTLAQQLLQQFDPAGYLNWDIAEHRERILKQELPPTPLWVFDELHKYRTWRNYLKGVYDQHKNERKILVTGSARLDYYRRGGDSLQGRYHYLRLHPLSFAELGMGTNEGLHQLLTYGGFPEPFFAGSTVDAKRWSRDYRMRLIQDDLVTLERIHDVGNLELLMLRLPDRVGAPLSVNALREDLQVSHKAVSNWIAILERLYAIFRVPPFGAKGLRAVKKEQKHYHYDWSVVTTPSYRFENLIASHLLKWVHYQQDTQGRDVELQYFRDPQDREVDFVVVEHGKPLQAIECKWGDDAIGKGLSYFKAKFPACEAWQISAAGTKDYLSSNGVRVAPAAVLLRGLV